MSDYTELKRLAEDVNSSFPDKEDLWNMVCTPTVALELIAEIERRDENPNFRAIQAARAEIDQLKASFKNFHRSLCERFGYFHDDADWQRDQVSLEEHIATQFNHVNAENSSLRGQMEMVQRGAGQLKAENEALESSRAKLAGELSRLRAQHKDWSVDAALGKEEQP
jgi:uncharacterized protein (DUF3084 family)